ncbi:TetR/AcrR family transcriptional regulator [Burkholderia stagnalis]|nr:TetR/AcrR family transcriptional regulator [Burkholderia stagnalis]KVC67780.1 TetR family transcriptional regulator [Burkholderia stagnalis]KVN23728.1 TetR family transcriptional regulator [Burkholderia stagnalis]KVN57333.1 TetR family transcriptional regulator [Burkholderia stagnalis]KVO52915.1 TetR family transcriptional regulator [Burkholderia stagnalis]KVP06794.1 TetR family transcriptional regulator [Burkholderia stagnalis]
MLTRDHWIAAGFDALDREGYPGVSVERLARRLNVTRGSFYHHFRSRDAFVHALLAQWEADYTARMLAHAAQGHSLEDVLARYLAIAAEKQPGREIAIRAWARRDPLAAEYQDRVDRTRLAFAIDTCRARLADPGHAELVGRVAHLCLIGGQQSGDRHQATSFSQFIRTALTQLHDAPRPNRP